MAQPPELTAAGGEASRRLCVYTAGFLRDQQLRRILTLAGWRPVLGPPKDGDHVGVWGQSPYARRGEAMAARYGAPILRVEDAFLRSVGLGREGEAPMGLLLDRQGVHFDASTPSDLEDILARDPLDDSALLARARDAMARLRQLDLSKYNGFDPDHPLPEAPYVLVIDQTEGDAAVRASGADRATFLEMLVEAQADFPGLPVVVKTHPETAAGHRAGHFRAADTGGRVTLLTDPVSPWGLMEGAVAVYTVSSGMGFEAILAGHKPRVFGQPFYAGWGLTEDRNPVPRRKRVLTRTQLFAGAMMLYPTWYDPYHDQLCALETVIDALEARVRALREDRAGYVCAGMRLWKRRPISAFFGSSRAPVFREGAAALDRARREGRTLMVWAGREGPEHQAGDVPLVRVEDGFLRSRGLGAELVPPLSLVRDDLGIYYDPTRESRLERLIAASVDLDAPARKRAEDLIARLTASGVTKYNLQAGKSDLASGYLLVPGQVEDDASIRLGAGPVATNLGLLQAARAHFPKARIVYKPHPDVEAGLRAGKVATGDALRFADYVADRADPAALIAGAGRVATMTSLLGFEALLRGVAVTTFGAPFYAGWGLTEDLGPVPERRQARPDLVALAHAVLLDYPRYFDPVTGQACPAEVAVARLEAGEIPRRVGNRALSKLQGAFASFAWIWR